MILCLRQGEGLVNVATLGPSPHPPSPGLSLSPDFSCYKESGGGHLLYASKFLPAL